MDEYTGRIVRHMFRAAKGSYAIAKFRTSPKDDGPQEEFTVVGPLKKFDQDHEIQITGTWTEHAKYGPQLDVVTAFWKVPRDKHAIQQHLKMIVRGVGERTLQKVVDYFGESTLDVLRGDSNRVNEITGVSKAIAKKISTGIRKDDIIRDLDLRLGDYQFPANTANRIFAKYGDQSQTVLDQNPYALVGVEGVKFKSADRFAQNSGTYDPLAMNRIEAFQTSLVREEQVNGNTCVSVVDLMEKTMRECGAARELAEAALTNVFANNDLILERVNTASGPLEVVYLPWNRDAEIMATRHFSRLLYASPEHLIFNNQVISIVDELEQLAQKKLTDKQRDAVIQAFASKISVVTGKPGTGKTTCLRAVVAVAERLGLKYALCAPTGRAAKNVTAATGKRAMTIHRLLEYKTEKEKTSGDDQLFKRHFENQLGSDLVIVDEASMLDTLMFKCLLAAIKDGARVVFVGDDNQLPSVGAGRVLFDIIRAGICPVTQLDIIHRQAQDSHIVRNAHRILAGEPMEFPAQRLDGVGYTDCVLLEAPMIQNEDTEKMTEDSAWVQHTIRQLCQQTLPTRCGIDPIRDVQILTPRKDGPCGVHELNKTLQQTLNPSGKTLFADKFGREFRQGDRVMVIKNNYDLDVFNGDIGIVRGYDLGSEALLINFYGEDVQFPIADLDKLTLSYAATVHKSQGSEYKVVVLVVLKQHGIMLQRNLLYTGITRAKEKLVVVGSRQALKISIRNVKPVQRNTLLWYRLSRLKINASAEAVN